MSDPNASDRPLTVKNCLVLSGICGVLAFVSAFAAIWSLTVGRWFLAGGCGISFVVLFGAALYFSTKGGNLLQESKKQ